MSLPGLTAASSAYDLFMYFIVYKVGNYLWPYFMMIPWFIETAIVPKFIQKFHINNNEGGQNTLTQVLNYLQELNPGKAYRDFNPWTEDTNPGFSEDLKKVQYSLAPGNHILTYKNRYVYISLEQQKLSRSIFNVLTISAFSTDPTFFDNLIKDSAKKFTDKRYVYVKLDSNVRTGRDGNLIVSWSRRKLAPVVTFADAIIAPENYKRLESAFKRFNSRPKREIELKIPHRLVILLSGPPGFGKTTLINAIAHELNLNIYATMLSMLIDPVIPYLFDHVKSNSCMVFEDIDSMTVNREGVTIANSHGIAGSIASDSKDQKNVSLSAVLNILDGLYAPDGSVIIMTTNYLERLDPALIRPERVHLHLKFGPDETVYERFTEKFYRDIPDSDIKQSQISSIVGHCMKTSISTSSLQSVFRLHENLDEAVKTVINTL